MSDLYNAISKIKSVVFNMAQERSIGASELADMNEALATAFEALEEQNHERKQLNKRYKASAQQRDSAQDKAIKAAIICQLLGLTADGVAVLTLYPRRFLKAILASAEKHENTFTTEEHFSAIRERFIWFNNMVDRDRLNTSAARVQKTLYNGNAPYEVKALALDIMKHVASESPHIVNALKDGKQWETIRETSEQHWLTVLKEKPILHE